MRTSIYSTVQCTFPNGADILKVDHVAYCQPVPGFRETEEEVRYTLDDHIAAWTAPLLKAKNYRLAIELSLLFGIPQLAIETLQFSRKNVDLPAEKSVLLDYVNRKAFAGMRAMNHHLWMRSDAETAYVLPCSSECCVSDGPLKLNAVQMPIHIKANHAELMLVCERRRSPYRATEAGLLGGDRLK